MSNDKPLSDSFLADVEILMDTVIEVLLLWDTNAVGPHHSTDVGDEFEDLRGAAATIMNRMAGVREPE